MATATHRDLQLKEFPVDDLYPHSAAEKVPRMRSEEWTSFLADVSRNGVNEPIVVQKGGVYIDGRHRVEAAKHTGATTIVGREVDLSESEQLDFIIRAALHRRHLSDSQRAILGRRFHEPIVAAAKTERASKGGKAGGKNHPKVSLQAGSTSKLKTGKSTGSRPKVAEMFNVSENQLRDATIVERANPELADKVLAGEVTLGQAKREVAREKLQAADDKPKELPRRLTVATSKLQHVHQLVTELFKQLDKPSLQVSIGEAKRKCKELLEAVSDIADFSKGV